MMLLANSKMRIIVTGKCNLSCFYCHNEGQAKENTFMDLHLLRAIAEAMAHASVIADEVTISGGEPLLHDHLADIVCSAASFSSSVTMVSNGLLASEERLSSLASAGLRKLRLGVDSLRDTKPRPSKGYLDKPFCVSDILMFATRLGLEVDMNVVVTRFNRKELGTLAEFAIDHGLSIKFFEHVDVGEFGSDGNGGMMTSRPQVDFEEFYQQVCEKFGSRLEFVGAGQFGVANVSCIVNGSEIRYCRYLCNYDLCWLTGTRVDARGYAYNCMVNRGIDRLRGVPTSETILQVLTVASRRPCRALIR